MTPRETRRFLVFGFETTHDALLAEDTLRGGDIDAVPVPTPYSLGAHCGIAMRVPVQQSEAARSVLEDSPVTPTSEALIDDI